MAKAQFIYDETGGTFAYFILSFLLFITIPSTYYLWPDKKEETEEGCRCCQTKRQLILQSQRGRKLRRQLIRGIIVACWAVILFIAFRCATISHVQVGYDPFEILGISTDATETEIKQAYRTTSLTHHPDKGGDPDKFMKIAKAYAALTDPESKKNWELYGNPDGPGATSFGIALPSWIVEKENSAVVLGIYILVFMVALPVSVGLWWYKSVKYGCDKVLLQTSELYYYFIHKTPHMALKRVIMILASSLEFSTSESRPEDNVEVPRLIRDLTNLGENNKERPLCYSYSIKARAILHAHLSRMKLPQNTLEVDRCFIVQKCPHLLQEFVQCVAQLITLALTGRIQSMPSLVTLENAMKLSPLIVQAMWEFQVDKPLLQLPHFTEDVLRQFERKKIKLSKIEQLSNMEENERRNILRNFTDSQYEDIKLVLSKMPTIQVETRFEVLDDEQPLVITAGAIVTVTVKLQRNPPGRHLVHCPYFPGDKIEGWWVYIVDRKQQSLVTAPLVVNNLTDIESVELKFTAPHRPKSYTYTTIVRSDSYVDKVVQQTTTIDVKPANPLEVAYEDLSEDEAEDDVEGSQDECSSAVEDPDLFTDEE